MYKEHRLFRLPENKDSRLLRYMTLPKFLNLISCKSLYLPNAQCFEDKWEGELSDVNRRIHNERIQGFYGGEISLDYIENMRKRTSHTFKLLKNCTFISSWNYSDYESPFLWNSFTQPNNGILIGSTISKLKDSVKYEDDFFLGQVKYYNQDEWFIGEGNTLSPFIWKRIEYSHENEIRLILQDENIIDSNGINLDVDLDTLISEIIISPNSDTWFKKLIIKILRDYRLENISVRNSDLDYLPNE